jgi:hypothetical protein
MNPILELTQTLSMWRRLYFAMFVEIAESMSPYLSKLMLSSYNNIMNSIIYI